MNKEEERIQRILEDDDTVSLTETTALEIWAEEYIMNNKGQNRLNGKNAIDDYHRFLKKIDVKDDFTTATGVVKYLEKISRQMGYTMIKKRTSKERYFYFVPL